MSWDRIKLGWNWLRISFVISIINSVNRRMFRYVTNVAINLYNIGNIYTMIGM